MRAVVGDVAIVQQYELSSLLETTVCVELKLAYIVAAISILRFAQNDTGITLTC